MESIDLSPKDGQVIDGVVVDLKAPEKWYKSKTNPDFHISTHGQFWKSSAYEQSVYEQTHGESNEDKFHS